MKNLQITAYMQHFIRQQVMPGDICIDATMGNGNDTALLSQLAGKRGRVLAFDIQKQALEHTKERLKRDNCPENYQLLLESHENMDVYAGAETVSCITFNLGYLPGGDHSVATRADSSIRAVESGLKLLKKGGLMTLCIYSGGDTGYQERDEMLAFIRQLIAYLHSLAAEKNAGEFKLPMSYTALAQYLSVDRSAMMREIKNLSDEGVIRRNGRNVELLK